MESRQQKEKLKKKPPFELDLQRMFQGMDLITKSNKLTDKYH